MRSIAFLLAAISLAVSAPAYSAAQTRPASTVQDESPHLVAALFRSSWCTTCRILEPRVDDVLTDYTNAPIDFIRFDFTFGRRQALRERAAQAGIADLYMQLEGRTGFMVLMDRDSGQVFEIVTSAYDRENIRAAFDRWLMVVGTTPSTTSH